LNKREDEEKMKRTGDLFEDLSAELGCIYISDLRLPPYREIACQRQFSGYPVSMWRDMLNYLDVESSAEVENEEQAKSTLSFI
jgi:hypothetical protein